MIVAEIFPLHLIALFTRKQHDLAFDDCCFLFWDMDSSRLRRL